MAMADTVWRVPDDHPALAGHFPGRPIVPGVVLLDRVVGLADQVFGRPERGWRVAQTKFLHPCVPGDELVFGLERSPRGAVVFVVRCDGQDRVSGSLVPLTA